MLCVYICYVLVWVVMDSSKIGRWTDMPKGKPKTQAQRRASHSAKYGAKSPLPKRGSKKK